MEDYTHKQETDNTIRPKPTYSGGSKPYKEFIKSNRSVHDTNSSLPQLLQTDPAHLNFRKNSNLLSILNTNQHTQSGLGESICYKKPLWSPRKKNNTYSLAFTECKLCVERIEVFAISKCNHIGVCYKCSLRLRVIAKNYSCPICRQLCENVLFSKLKIKYEDYNMDSRLLSNEAAHFWDPINKIYYGGNKIKQLVIRLLSFFCVICKKEENSLNDLKEHVQLAHDLYYCDLCLAHLHLFISEQNLYTKEKLELHYRKGDRGDRAHRGHFLCQFCNDYYFDETDLYNHLREKHYSCHICARRTGGGQSYFVTYSALESHFSQKHFLCIDKECLEKKFIVFETEMEYKAHLADMHMQGSSRNQKKQLRLLELDFDFGNKKEKSRNKNRNKKFLATTASANDLPQNTRLGEEKAPSSFESVLDPVAFPSLPGATAKPFLYRPVKHVKKKTLDEEFPPLPSSSLQASFNPPASLKTTSFVKEKSVISKNKQKQQQDLIKVNLHINNNSNSNNYINSNSNNTNSSNSNNNTINSFNNNDKHAKRPTSSESPGLSLRPALASAFSNPRELTSFLQLFDWYREGRLSLSDFFTMFETRIGNSARVRPVIAHLADLIPDASRRRDFLLLYNDD